MAEHKGFDASPKKIREARKKGRVLKSQLLTQAFVNLAILFCVIKGLSFFWISYQQMLEWCLSVPLERLGSCTMRIGFQTLWVVIGSLLCGAIIAGLVEFLQVRFEFYWEAIGPQLDRLNPASGFKRIGQGLCRSWLTLLKLIFILMLTWHLISGFSSSMQTALLIPIKDQVLYLTPQVINISYLSSAILLIFGGIEYLANRKNFMKEQSMSHDEVRREYKEDEGDPHVKSHRKALHESMVMQEMVKRVRSSKVIIVD